MLDAPLLALLAFLPILYGSSFLHELGHAVAGYLAGMEVTSFGMGTGRPFWVGRWRGVRVYLCRERPFQGLTFFGYPAIIPGRWPTVWTHAGGILAHVLLTGVALALWYGLPWGQPVWAVAAGLNALFAVVNLYPFASRVGRAELRSDGSLILQTLLYGSTRNSAPRVLAALRQLRGLWEATGDLRGLQNYLLWAGLSWAELGDNEQAGQLLDQAAALPVAPPPPIAALLTAGRGLAADQFEAGVAALDEAEGAFRRLNHPGGLLLTAWWRAGWRLGQGEAARAVETLDALASDPLVVRRTFLRVSLLGSRVQARAALGDGDGVEKLLNEYEAQPAARRTRADDLQVYRSLGRFFLGGGDEARAVAARSPASAGPFQVALGVGADTVQPVLRRASARGRGLEDAGPGRAGATRTAGRGGDRVGDAPVVVGRLFIGDPGLWRPRGCPRPLEAVRAPGRGADGLVAGPVPLGHGGGAASRRGGAGVLEAMGRPLTLRPGRGAHFVLDPVDSGCLMALWDRARLCDNGKSLGEPRRGGIR
jgi:hypothetical protein